MTLLDHSRASRKDIDDISFGETETKFSIFQRMNDTHTHTHTHTQTYIFIRLFTMSDLYTMTSTIFPASFATRACNSLQFRETIAGACKLK